MASFLAAFRAMVPAWLSAEDTEGESLLGVISVMLDALDERWRASLETRFPTRGGEAAATLTGRDRGIRRGRTETLDHYAARLKRWRWPRGHRVRGNAYAALEQISEYFGGAHCWTIAANGGRRELFAGGTTARAAQAWTWDAATDLYRFWVVLDPAQTFRVDVRSTWAGLTHADAIGMTGIAPGDAQAMRDLFRPPVPWHMAGTTPQWLIVTLIAGTDPTPDATWATWGGPDGVGAWRPTRDPNFRYIAFRPYAYAGDPASFPNIVQTLLGDSAGDPTAFASSVALPGSGATFAGDPATFPTSVVLPDDGDPPL